MADFDTVYNQNFPVEHKFLPGPTCVAPACFVGSYPPVTPAGQMGPFFVNSYFLRPDRIRELAGPVCIRSNDIKNNGRC
mgnify:FL=1|jgi:hypothetical protein